MKFIKFFNNFFNPNKDIIAFLQKEKTKIGGDKNALK